jgi:dihydroorotase
MSQGDAGAGNWPAYRDKVIGECRTRVLLAINLSVFGESHPDGCFPDLESADIEACVAAIADRGDVIWGIAANTGPSNPTPPQEILSRAIAVAERTDKPLLIGCRLIEDWTLDDQLPLLRPGDVVTYCFNDFPESIVRDGRIRPCVWEARARGVLFDVGHGMNSFSFSVAEAAIADGFTPDTISTDQYNRHIGSVPQHDLPRTISKLIAVGMLESEAFARATVRPAKLLGLKGEVGTLRPGACADLSVLSWNESALPLEDVRGEGRPGGCWEPTLTVRAGQIVLNG